MIRLRILLLLVLLLMTAGAAEEARRSVLCLHSYHPADWSDTVQSGWRERLASREGLDLVIEYMDTKRREDDAYLALLAEVYRRKYEGVRFSLILTSDDHAYRFALAHRKDLFSDAPLVFCGVNRWKEVVANRPANVTGVAEQASWAETLAMARSVRPQARAVHVISDDTETAQKNLDELRNALASTPGLTLDHETGLDLAGLTAHLARLPPEDIAIFIAFWRQPDGRAVSPDELSHAMRNSAAPVFGRSEWAIGRGQAGGMCVSGVRQGRAAASLGLAILDGCRADDLPLVTDSPNVAMFDWEELTHHGIDTALLPADAEILNRPDPWLRIPRAVVAMAVACLVLLVLLVIALVVLMRLRRSNLAALAASEANLRAILQSMGDGVIAADAQDRITGLNPVAERLTGWPRAEALGRTVGEVFHLVDAAGLPLPPGTPHQAGSPPLLLDRQGGRRHVADGREPLRDHAGRTVGTVLVFRDVSERVALEERLRRAQTMEALGRMAGGIAHDFNNQLTGILGGAQLLRQRLPAGDDAMRLAGQIESAAQRAAELTAKLLTLSRNRPGPPGACDLQTCIEAVTALLRHAMSRGIDLRVEGEAGPVWVHGDRVTLENALLNLCLNARDAMPDGGCLRITTVRLDDPPPGTAANPEGWMRLSVADTGTGMDEATRTRVFEPFFTTKPAGKGTGLGLTMVYAAISELGGQVHLASAPGRGTTVTLDLPRCPPPPPTIAAPPPVGSRPSCVLVVDDDPAALAVAREVLAVDGHEVLTAADGVAGAELFSSARDRIGVVVLDMMMPRCDGRCCLASIRALRPDVRAIMLSGYTGDAAAAEGFDAVLAKPYHLDDLRRAVAEQLARR